ncbi:MAG: hypothetical protein QM762_14665 [Chryseolinea sp.]
MNKVFVLLMVLGSLLSSHAQNIDSLTLSHLRVNFTVPDMPAFKTLGTDPSNLLKPSTPQTLAVSLSSFVQGTSLVVPEGFAIEVSPALLLNTNRTLQHLSAYAKRAVLNSFRISLGSSTDTTLSRSGRNLAVGFRVSLINEGDFATDVEQHKKVAAALGDFRVHVRETSRLKFASLKNIDSSQPDWDTAIAVHGVWKKEFDEYLASEEEESQRLFMQKLKELKSEYKKVNWNAKKLDVALAILYSSPDSLVKNIRFNRADFWLAGALRTGRNSQFMYGLNARTFKDLKNGSEQGSEKTYFNISVPARYLIGTNRLKGFGELQYSFDNLEERTRFLINLGSEINVVDGLWINFYGGLDYDTDTGDGSLVTNFNIKLTMPERFSFF